MESLSASWWEEGSVFQFLIPLIVGVLVGVLGVWATLRASHPKRVFNWWAHSNKPLVGRELGADPDDGLTLHFRHIPLEAPRIIELVLANQGRRDITAAMFHNDDPIEFELGARVISILELTSTPEGTYVPRISHEDVSTVGRQVNADTWLRVAPSLLRRGQTVVITLLVDGPAEEVKCVASPLVDVKTVSRPPGASISFAGVALQVASSAIRMP
ncbi:hypothetical protein OG418_29570 [Streptomyces phaeochromogenes]|uniref:hypothetical protein n=1 Tax=Streptomyces phaeochromogenes TaxID=1923 RepID=UPI00324F70A5